MNMRFHGSGLRVCLAFLAALSVFVVPALVFAQDGGGGGTGCMASLPSKLGGLLKGSSSDAGQADEGRGGELSCPSPYMESAGECCLDRDGNGVCDRDEAEPATTLGEEPEETSTTEAPTTAEAPATTEAPTTAEAPAPTTTAAAIACYRNSDCGQEKRENVCKDGDLYVQQSNPVCNNPGKTGAECKWRTKLVGQTLTQSAIPLEKCVDGCRDGACL